MLCYLTHRLKTTVATLLVLALALIPLHVLAAPPAPSAKISFTFDDGLTSSLTKAAPALKKYGLHGTQYIATSCVGTSGTCPADKQASYMNWAQVKRLQNDFGWEIGGHTRTHHPLTTLTNAQQETEIRGSKQDLAAQGITATSFASPEGDYNQKTIELVAKYYTSHRGFWDQGANTYPYSDYLIRVQQVQVGVSVASVKASIDKAIANKQWVVLVFHDIKDKPSADPQDYNYSTANLDAIAAYAASKQAAGKITEGTVSKNLATGSQNKFSGSSFANGITNGWTTDTPALVTANANDSGSTPNPLDSVRFASGSQNAHLYSPRVSVSHDRWYLFKNYLTVRQITTGEVGFYIDEYDASGQWISGQWKAAERTKFAQKLNFTYQPSSIAVKQASLQIYATANPGITAFLDNVQMYDMGTASVTAPINLATNGTFDLGISQGWTTDDPGDVTADVDSHGSPSNPGNSVKMSVTGDTVHLFSPNVPVNSSAKYSLATYRNIVSNNGEFGIYIDEYDASGNWISGQWKHGDNTVGAGEISTTYIPTSTAVSSARLQFYAQGQGTLTYVDDVRWYQL